MPILAETADTLALMDRHRGWFELGYACVAGLLGYLDVFYEGKPGCGCFHWWTGSVALGGALYEACDRALWSLFLTGMIIFLGLLFAIGFYAWHTDRHCP